MLCLLIDGDTRLSNSQVPIQVQNTALFFSCYPQVLYIFVVYSSLRFAGIIDILVLRCWEFLSFLRAFAEDCRSNWSMRYMINLKLFYFYSQPRLTETSLIWFLVSHLFFPSLAVLEGIAIGINPNYKVLGSTYPWIARKILTDSSPQLKSSLQSLLYEVLNYLVLSS